MTTLLLLLALTSPVGAQTPVPATSRTSEAVAPNGLKISADLHDEYIVGFKMLVSLTVRNDGDTPLTFPDLSARPHLVRFGLELEKHRTERYTTPPMVDSGATWTIPPRSRRRVLLEIPSSSGFDAGPATLTVAILDPAGAVSLPPRAIRFGDARPVGGTVVYEPTISSTSGAMLAWTHQATSGFDLYLTQWRAADLAQLSAQYHLVHLEKAADPVLSRARATDAGFRYVYWKSAASSFTYVRLDGAGVRNVPRTISVPWPMAEPLARGVTDAQGKLIIPVWIPAPKGTGGTVRALCIDDRGNSVPREVVDLPTRPASVATAVDASGNLVLALGHAAALDVYKVDASLASEMPAKGNRVTRLEEGWQVSALTFDTLPERGDHAGGLALLAVMSRQGEDGVPMWRSTWYDLGGKLIEEGRAARWVAKGEIAALLPAGYEGFYYLTHDAKGAWWFGAQGGTPVKVEGAGPGALWPSPEAVMLRQLAPGRVFVDRAMGPRTK